MRYILYARKSSESEERQVQSIDDQLRVLRDFAQQRDLEVVDEITESKSAKEPGNRPDFDRMLFRIENGEIDAILCWSVNRLTRNPIDAGKLSWLLQRGVLHAIQTPDRYFLPTDNVLLLSVETGTANQYILDLQKSVKRGLESKVRKGWFPQRAPEGYRNNLETHTIEPDGLRFTLLQRAWRLLIDETYTVAQVHHLLNTEWGYVTRPRPGGFGKPLSRSAAYRLFGNIFYAGHFRYNEQVYSGSHEPMVSLSEYEAVQRQLSRQIGKAHYLKHGFPYAGMILCGSCGKAVTGEMQRGRGGKGEYIYYRCVHCSAGGAHRASIRQDVLEKQIDACLAQITITPQFAEIVRQALVVWMDQEAKGQNAEYRQNVTRLADQEAMLDELMDLRLNRLIDNTTFQNKGAELRLMIGNLRLCVARTQERLDRTRRLVNEAMDFRLTAREQFLTGSMEKRRAIARTLAVKYVLNKGEVFIELHPLLAYEQKANTEPAIFEPQNAQKIGSGSTKGAPSSENVPLGWPCGTEFEPLYQMFASIYKSY